MLDQLPLWALFSITCAIVLAALEGGYRWGAFALGSGKREGKASVGEMVRATKSKILKAMPLTPGRAMPARTSKE